MKIYNGYKRLPRNYTLMTDEYEFTMANGYYQNGMQNQIAAFDVFFRKVPNNGGYAIMAGLYKVIEYIKDLALENPKYRGGCGLAEFDHYFRSDRLQIWKSHHS